jgi:hypothetical protein
MMMRVQKPLRTNKKNINKKKMKRLLIFLIISTPLIFSGCTSHFEEMNTDPNKVVEINPSSLLSPIIYNTTTSGISRANGFTHELMQYNVPVVSRSFGVHRYEFDLSIGSSMWSSYYRNLTNINDLVNVATAKSDNNSLAIGLIIRAWFTSITTDVFGDIPYQQASSAEQGILQPEFDSQETIYLSILSDLEKANTMLGNNTNAVSGDLLFSGNMGKWKKMCNSLRLRLLLRTKNVVPGAEAKIKEIINNPATFPVIDNKQDDAILKFTNVSPFNNPFLSARYRDFSEDFGFSTYFVSKMEALSDPRFYMWATKSGVANSVTGYDGILSGYDAETIFQAGRFSSFVAALQSSSQIGAIITCAEVEFIKAELALSGIISSDPETHYKNGVVAAIERWGLLTPDNYFVNSPATYNGTLEQIIFQKYINYLFTDYQAWFEKRRTGYPDFPLTQFMDNGGVMPSRLPYPPQVSFYNQENYEKAIQSLGGNDDINKKVWWDKK